MTGLLLRHGDWLAEIRPDLGGAVSRLDWRGHRIFRPLPPGSEAILETGSFPLVPYANRIAQGRIGQGPFADVSLPLNFGGHPHSLHGIGWQSPWQVGETGDDFAELLLDAPSGPGWPWHIRSRQLLSLEDNSATFRIDVTNADRRPMPAGLGFHPYFPLYPESRLQARATRVWLGDSDQLPTEPAPADHFGDWKAGASLAGSTLIDSCYEGWDGEALIHQPEFAIRISSEGARAFQLYRPPNGSFFCFEPVSHMPDAHNRPEFALDTIEPGETLSLCMRLEVA